MDDESEIPREPRSDERLESATRLADQGLWADAYEILRELEQEGGEDPTLLCLLGSVANELAAFDRAHDYFARTLAARPEDPLVLVTAGTALARWDDPQAESALRLAALTAPDLAVTRLCYGSYLAREGFFDEAIAELEAAHRLESDDPEAPRELGVAQLLAGRPAPAAEWLEQALARAEDDADTRFLYGLALLQAGRPEDAAEQLHRVSLELPHDGDAQVAAGLACISQGWEDEGWSALARAANAEDPPLSELLEEADEAAEAGAEAAEWLLREQVAPSLVHDRIVSRR